MSAGLRGDGAAAPGARRCEPRLRAGRRSALALALAGAALVVPPARAAHPMLNEDTGTQGRGRFELELGNQLVRDGGDRAYEFGPQLSYGVADTLDVIVRPTWLDLSGGGATSRGAGDTALDFKWRFLQRDALSFGVRAGADLPTGNEDAGRGAGKAGFHGVLIATCDAEPWSFSANAGTIHVGAAPLQRRDLYLVSAAAVWTPHEGLKLTAELGAASNPDPDRATWPAVARVGAILTATPWLDVDAGYQGRLNHAAPAQAFLAGATIHW